MRIVENNNGSCYAFWERRMRQSLGFKSCFLGGVTYNGYDMAILVLKSPTILGVNVMPAILPDENEDCIRIGKHLIAGGWGYGIPTPGSFEPYPNRWSRYPWAIKQQCMKIEDCNVPRSADRESILCVGDKEKNYNTACRSDSGGPLTFSKGNKNDVDEPWRTCGGKAPMNVIARWHERGVKEFTTSPYKELPAQRNLRQ